MDLTGKNYDELLALYMAGVITRAQFAAAYVPSGDGLPVTIIGAAEINWWFIAALVGVVVIFGKRDYAKQYRKHRA